MPIPVRTRPVANEMPGASPMAAVAAPSLSNAAAGGRRLPLWAALLVIGIIVGLTTGRMQSMGLYVAPLTEALKIGREPFGLAMALTQLVLGFGAPVAGALIDRYGAGRVIVVATLAAMAGLVCLNAAQAPSLLIVGGVLLGVGVSGTGISALVGVAGRLAPPEQRLAAMATIGMSASIGSLVALPFVHVLIEMAGWRGSLLWLAAITALIIPLAWPISGRQPLHAGERRDQTMRQALSEALHHPSFVLLTLGYFVCGFQVMFVQNHLPAFALDMGLPGWAGPTALTVLGVSNIAGTWLVGRLGGVLENRQMLIVLYLGRAALFVSLLFVPITATGLIVFCALLGLIWLATIPLTSSLVATFFGTAWLSMLYGLVIFCHQIGAFLGIWLGGRIFDVTRSYDLMWWISAALGLIAALVHWPIKERPVERLAGAGASVR